MLTKNSLNKLNQCHSGLQLILKEVIKTFDFTVTEGHRSIERQLELYKKGLSKVKKGKHNFKPSMAVDIHPYPIDFDDMTRYYYLAGLIKGIALKLGINIRWGGCWNNDNKFKENKFKDLGHYEII